MPWARSRLVYPALLAGSFAAAVAASWTAFGTQIDNDAYDFFFRLYRPTPWNTEAVLLAIDEESLTEFNGIRRIRKPLAEGLNLVAQAGPRAVAVDLILSEESDPQSDALLETAFRSTPRLVLACDLFPRGAAWEDPLPAFRRHASAIGHVYAEPDRLDSVSREIPLEKASAARDRRWALALEAFRVSRGAAILESPDDLQVGGMTIPSRRTGHGRLMRIRYVPPGMPPIPQISLKDLLANPRLASRCAGKVVFAGVTAQTEGDRLFTPYSAGVMTPGLEIHANAFETMAQRLFITDAPLWQVLIFAALLVVAAGLTFAFLSGWQSYTAAGAILLAAHAAPYVFFTKRQVFSFATPVSTAWLSLVCAAGFQNLVVRRRLRRSEAERSRYQQAMHFVTHEMRTPLTAIQGSSELISRYAMTDEKRKQIAQLINSESKRLGRMIEMFLNVERLSAGQMELKQEHFAIAGLLEACVERTRPLAERKQIRVVLEPVASGLGMTGDRELMEYAVYNLLTNAVKYSPRETQVTAAARLLDHRILVSVRDQGIGMDKKEVKQIFQKFYRTRKAEESGEAGTGIGLSIVEQIVLQHRGSIEVTSRPGRGSCFTLAVPAAVPAVAAERN